MHVIRFDAIIGAYLGQTATNLRQLFRFAERSPSILLFDEIDALGKQRGNPSDVGELDRIVIALMQELELTQPKGLIIATSNLPEHLDRALWRRFDLQVRYPAPKKADLKAFATSIVTTVGGKLPRSVVTMAETAKSYADVELLVLAYFRERALVELKASDGRDRKCPGAERHRGRPPNLQSTQFDPRIYEEMRIGDDLSVGLDL